MKGRLLLWALLCLGITLALFPRLWSRLSPFSVKDLYGPSLLNLELLGLLALLVLWARRREIWTGMGRQPSLFPYPMAGLGALVGLLLLPTLPPKLLPLHLLLSYGAAFALFFGPAARFPFLVAGIVGLPFLVSFLLERVKEGYTLMAAKVLVGLLAGVGFPVNREGIAINFPGPSQENVGFVMNMACAGSVSMGFFLALFSLMMLDRPLPRGRAGALLALGIGGTWLQNLLRLMILVLSGRYGGQAGLNLADSIAGYPLFLLWFGFFAWLYLRQAAKGTALPRPL